MKQKLAFIIMFNLIYIPLLYLGWNYFPPTTTISWIAAVLANVMFVVMDVIFIRDYVSRKF